MPPVRRFARLGGLLVAALVVASVAAGCSSGGSASIKVTEPWARASSAMAAAGAAYMTIENTGTAADALSAPAARRRRPSRSTRRSSWSSPAPAASDGMGSPAAVGLGRRAA